MDTTPFPIQLPADRTVVVVGGCGGIGHAMVQEFAAQHLTVVVMDLPASLAARSLPTPISSIAVDVRDEASVESAFAQLADTHPGGIDYLVNVAGYTGDLRSVEHLDTTMFDDIHSGNLRGLMLCCRHALPLLRKDQGAGIVNVSTGIANIGAAGYASYASAKAGVNALTRILAAETAPQGIRVNAIAPGGVDTAFLRGGFGRGGREDGAPLRLSIEDYAKRVPLGRIGTAADMVGPVLFLLSDAAAYVTGQVLHVNGGALMRD